MNTCCTLCTNILFYPDTQTNFCILRIRLYNMYINIHTIHLTFILISNPFFSIQFPDLASFLIARACRSTRLANFFHWYVSVECQEDKDLDAKKKYECIRQKFMDDLKNVR